MKHQNNGSCPKCAEIFEKYPGFNALLRAWFEERQAACPEFHCSDAGRGRVDQETYFMRGASLAHYGESAHNFNCGLDSFFQIDGKYSVGLPLYELHIEPYIPDWLQWGHYWKGFRETPHFELKAWKLLRIHNAIKLVEE
jgi:hypothetical protein